MTALVVMTLFAASPAEADTHPSVEMETTADPVAQTSEWGKVVGSILGTKGEPVPMARAWLYRYEGGQAVEWWNDWDSDFSFDYLPPGIYTAEFTGTGFLTEWWDDQPEATATMFEVRAGETVTLDARLTLGGVISGYVEDEHGNDMRGGYVDFWRKTDTGWTYGGGADVDVNYKKIGLPAGQYALAIRGDYRYLDVRAYAGEWSNDQPDRSSADLVNVAEGAQVRLGVTRLADAEPTLSTPEIWGEAVVGSKLLAAVSKMGSVSYAFQWLANGEPIPGATDEWMTLTADLLGKRISVRFSGWTTQFPPVIRTSEATSPVVYATLEAAKPIITGVPLVGSTLRAEPGSWPTGTTFEYAWFADGKSLDSATSETMTLSSNLLGKRITVRVTGSKTDHLPVLGSLRPRPIS